MEITELLSLKFVIEFMLKGRIIRQIVPDHEQNIGLQNKRLCVSLHSNVIE
jgi:hypothetical protein